MTRIYYFYIARCIDNSLYCGITTDLIRRINEHNNSERGAKYTRAKRPVQLIYFEKYESRSAASKREFIVKKMTKKEKELLIRSSL